MKDDLTRSILGVTERALDQVKSTSPMHQSTLEPTDISP